MTAPVGLMPRCCAA